MFIWSLSHSEERNSPGNCPNPSVETISYREMSWSQEHTYTHPDTLPHTHPNMWTQKAAETQTPKNKDSETRTPTTTAHEAVLHCWQKSKEILARLSKVVPTKKYKQWSKIYKFTWCHIGAQIKLHWWTSQDGQMHLHSKTVTKSKKKTFMMTRDYQSKLVNTIEKNKNPKTNIP